VTRKEESERDLKQARGNTKVKNFVI